MQDKLLACYVSVLSVTPSEFVWEDVSEFANFGRVTVGSFINMYKLQKGHICRLFEIIAPAGYSASTMDKKAKQLLKEYTSSRVCVSGVSSAR